MSWYRDAPLTCRQSGQIIWYQARGAVAVQARLHIRGFRCAKSTIPTRTTPTHYPRVRRLEELFPERFCFCHHDEVPIGPFCRRRDEAFQGSSAWLDDDTACTCSATRRVQSM